jgi:tetratricopeptide (TPR) repeat protein
VKRLAALLAVVACVVVGGVVAVQVQRDARYRELLTAGERSLEAGNAYAAIEAFSGALALRPRSMVAYYRRGEAYRVLRQDAEAIDNVLHAHRLAPEAPQPLVTLGEIYDVRGEPAQAAHWYAQAVELLGDSDPGALYALALARYRAGHPAAAQGPLERAVAHSQSPAEAHYLLGLVHRDKHEIAAAISSLERAVQMSPSLLGAREELADLYAVEGRPQDEMRQLQALVSADPHLARRVAIAMAEARGGEFDAALRTLAAAASAPGAAASASPDSRIHLALGRVYLMRAERTGDRTAVVRARDALEQALGGTARRSEGLALYGRALFLSGEMAKAEQMLVEAVATSPVSPQAFAYLADAAERLGHPLDARDALVQLEALEGDTAGADVRAARLRRIGLLSLRAGDPRKALTSLTHAVDLGLVDVVTLGHLAEARWQTGDEHGARDTLDRALALAPQDPQLQRLSRQISRPRRR